MAGISLYSFSERLITLLLLCTFSTDCAATIHTDQHAIGWLGQDVCLPCNFTFPDVIALYWTNSSGTTKVSFFRENPNSFDDRFTLNDDFSLVIRDVQVSDEGRYSCHLELDSGQSFTNHTELSIYASPSIPHIEQCAKGSSENNIMKRHRKCIVETSNTHPFNLDCRVTGFRPNVTLMWMSSGIEKQPIGEPFQRELPDGTWEREISLSVTAKLNEEQNYTCMVRGEATNLTSWTTTVTVLVTTGIVPSGLPIGAKVGIGIVVILVFIFILVVAIQKVFVRRQSRGMARSRRKSVELQSKNKDIKFTPVSTTPPPNIEVIWRRNLYPGMKRPFDVICHQGRYIVTDRRNNRVISVNPADNSSDVLCNMKQGSLQVNMSPFGIVALSDSEQDFLFTDTANRCILHYLNNNCYKHDKCVVWSKLPQNGCPYGITVDAEGLVYVADNENHCIQVFDNTGKHSNSFGNRILKSPWFLKFNSKGHLFVTDEDVSVKIFKKNGEFVDDFKVRTDNRSWSCRGITIDKFDNIFVTARADISPGIYVEKVSIYNHDDSGDYKPISCFGGYLKFKYVQGVCCDYINNNLVVVETGWHRLKLYKLYNQQPQTITKTEK